MKKLILILNIIFILLLTISVVGVYINKYHVKQDTKTEVVFWTLQLGTFRDYVNNVIAEFEHDNTEIKIKWVDIPYSEGEKRTLASILSDNPPDLVNSTPDFSLLLAQKNALYLLDETLFTQYLPEITNSLIYNGKYYSFPFYATSAITYYNKDLLKKANIQIIPKTYEELFALAQNAKKINVFITMPALAENDTTLKVLNKYGINSPENIASKESTRIFNQYKYLYNNNLIPKESITQTHREALEKYMSGQIIFYPGGANFLNIIKENSPEIYKVTDITNQLTGTNGKYDYSLMNLIIPKKAKNKDAAVKFALFLTNKENQLELAKLTTILPVNKYALEDDYFKINNTDIQTKSRAVSASQLNNIQTSTIETKNRKELLNLINNYTQQIILSKKNTEVLLLELSEKWKKL